MGQMSQQACFTELELQLRLERYENSEAYNALIHPRCMVSTGDLRTPMRYEILRGDKFEKPENDFLNAGTYYEDVGAAAYHYHIAPRTVPVRFEKGLKEQR